MCCAGTRLSSAAAGFLFCFVFLCCPTPHPYSPPSCLSAEDPLRGFSVAAVWFRSFQLQVPNPSPPVPHSEMSARRKHPPTAPSFYQATDGPDSIFFLRGFFPNVRRHLTFAPRPAPVPPLTSPAREVVCCTGVFASALAM